MEKNSRQKNLISWADLKEAVYDTIEEKGRLDHEMIAEKVFKENITAKLAFKEEVQEQGFVPEAPPVKEVQEISEKKFGKQKFKLSKRNRTDCTSRCISQPRFD